MAPVGSEVAAAALLNHLGVLPAEQRDEILHPPVRNVVGLLSARCAWPKLLAGEGLTVTLDILDIGTRGDGIAEDQGRRYFVPFTLPGERVEAEPRGEHRPGRSEGIAADLVEVLAPSRHRETPPCAHFKVCGGCALQHWRRDAYTAWKSELIARALAQRGVAAPRFEPPLVGAPGERRRADFVLRRQGSARAGGLPRTGESQDRRCRHLRGGATRPRGPAGAAAQKPRRGAARGRRGGCDRERNRQRC
jgi:hypothetical protein